MNIYILRIGICVYMHMYVYVFRIVGKSYNKNTEENYFASRRRVVIRALSYTLASHFILSVVSARRFRTFRSSA